MKPRRIAVLAVIAAAAALAYGIWLWNTTHFHLGYWLQVHSGTVNEAGPYYGFFSGSGSDLGEITLIAGVVTLIAGMWHKFNCHTAGCYRIGIHHVAGGQYVACRKHHNEITGHPHRKLTIGHLRQAHLDHLARTASDQTSGAGM